MATLSHATTSQQSSALLLESLASVLPKGYRFGAYHLSTPPTKTNALCSPPPDERPDRTYCENHFLAITIDAKVPGAPEQDAKPVLVLALEVFIFTTAFSSVFFVSKADSTGYLNLLSLPKETPSPIREVSTAFMRYLVEQRRRKGLQCVVSLFARAQGQYLFPGSVENKGKHVLDDRGLVKWWCRVLNPLVESPPAALVAEWSSVKAYLVIPGLDHYETRAFLPRTPTSAANWILGNPMAEISHYTREYDWVPARCLIPRYPDDPKSRFRDELDVEAAKSKTLQDTGSWKSITTVDQFWEMMAFRQECSSGRMTGFMWVVLNPKEHESHRRDSHATASTTLPTPQASFDSSAPPARPSTPPSQSSSRLATPLATPRKLVPATPSANSTPSKTKKEKKKKKRALSGEIRPRKPHVKTEQRKHLRNQPISTAYYFWPAEGRGKKIVDESDYKRAVELLLRLDFANFHLATGSTQTWLNEIGMGAKWGLDIVGRREIPSQQRNGNAAPAVNILTAVKRKRTEAVTSNDSDEQPGSRVNVLGGGMVRKKPKEEPQGTNYANGVVDGTPSVDRPGPAVAAPAVNVLGAGFVRKPKA